MLLNANPIKHSLRAGMVYNPLSSFVTWFCKSNFQSVNQPIKLINIFLLSKSHTVKNKENRRLLLLFLQYPPPGLYNRQKALQEEEDGFRKRK